MKLTELNARFIRREVKEVPKDQFVDGILSPSGFATYFPDADTLADAHGVMFLCPKCFAAKGGKVGTHSVICWFAGRVADDAEPKPGRWNPSGSGLGDITFVGPGAVSVQVIGGCGWHGFVTNGDAT